MSAESLSCDVLVVGSGAAGLSTALAASVLGLEVLVCEQAPVLGGASALSGGEVWIPLNRQNGGAAADSEADALTYLAGVIGPGFERARAEAFVRHAAGAFAFLEDHSELAYEPLSHVVDYFSEQPGATSGIRTLGAIPFDGRRLGARFREVRSPLPAGMIFGGMSIGREDLPHLMNVTRSLGSVRHVTGMLLRHARDRLLGHPRGTRMVMGNALVGRLLVTLFGRRVPFWREAAVTGLVTEDGRVTGADVRHAGRVQRILCRGGVVLANGSFSGNPAMRERYFPHVRAGRFHHSHVPASSDGSGIALALACGATVDDSLPQSGAWTPVSMLPSRAGPAAAFSHFGDRAKPGVIVVNRAGRRFANEALNYHDFLQAMFRDCADAPEVEAFVITSHRHLRSYGLGRVPPFPGRIGPFLRSAYLQRGRTITELARNIGVDPPALEETVRRFNEHARRGVDPDFHKGESTWDRACGDPQVSPNPCLAPLNEGPWYAIRMVPGDIGTMTGVRTDPDARVLDAGGSPIPGLYAVGTVASSIMRGTYPAAGVMLGPALTFGYLAACDIAGRRP